MSRAQLIIAGIALSVLGMFGETLILKGQAQLAMQIATGVIGALNLVGAGQAVARAVSASPKDGA